MAAPLVYTHPWRSFFVAKDIEGLRREHVLSEHAFNSGHPLLLPWDLLRQLFFMLKAKAQGAHTAIVHFAGYHSVLPIMLGFRTFVIVAGADSCSFPGIGYGSFRKRWMAAAMRYTYRRASMILPVHASLERFQNRYSDAGPCEQGYAVHTSGMIAPSLPLPYGFDLDRWVMPDLERDNKSVLCIATGAAIGNAIHYRKGLDLLIQAAKHLPDTCFTIVGTSVTTYDDVPQNMRFQGMIHPEEIPQLFAAHGIYAQPSIMDGFPNALCEAMLMGCLPIASAMTSMPDIVGDTGQIINQRDPRALIDAILHLQALPAEEVAAMRERARQKILPYTMERRLKVLNELIRQTGQR